MKGIYDVELFERLQEAKTDWKEKGSVSGIDVLIAVVGSLRNGFVTSKDKVH